MYYFNQIKMKKLIICFCCLVGFNFYTNAQNNSIAAFQDEINAFAKADSLETPIANSILFVGSSSFNYWKDIKNYFPGYPIINRGFGGSSLTDVIHFSKQTIIKYHPKQIYIYCGENDFAANDSITPQIVFNRFKTLFNIIRTKLGAKIPVLYVSIKPSVARWNLEPRFVKANKLIQDYLASQKNAILLDVHHAMLDENGQVFKDIFIADNLHMNAKGYRIWQKIIAPTLMN
jgi:lysophospholipase L1-like esterase